MDKETFVEIIQRCPHLNEEQKKSLTDDVDWTSPQERQSFINGLVKADQDLEEIKNRPESSANMEEELLKSLETFQKEEVPKLIKQAEKDDKGSAEEEAKKLLKDMK